VADAILYALSCPDRVNIDELMLSPVEQVT